MEEMVKERPEMLAVVMEAVTAVETVVVTVAVKVAVMAEIVQTVQIDQTGKTAPLVKREKLETIEKHVM